MGDMYRCAPHSWSFKSIFLFKFRKPKVFADLRFTADS